MKVSDLKKYKDNCYSALSRDLTEFEKNFLLISGGILAFSTTFIKDIVQLSTLLYLPLLFAAWGFIIISIGLMMVAFLKSATASDKLLNAVDTFEMKYKLFDESTKLSDNQCLEIKRQVSNVLKHSKASLKGFRNSAVGFFLLGILLLAVFVSLNLLHEQTNERLPKNAVEVSKGEETISIVEK